MAEAREGFPATREELTPGSGSWARSPLGIWVNPTTNWDEALREADRDGRPLSGQRFFLSRDWLRNLSKVVDLEGEPILFSAQALGYSLGTIASFPMVSAEYRWLRQLSGFSHPHSPMFGPIRHLPVGSMEEIARAFVDTVTANRPSWDVVDLAKMDPSSEAYTATRDAFLHRGWRVQEFYCFGNWYLPCEGLSFYEYLADRPSVLKNTVRRKTRKFLRSPEARLAIYDSTEGVEEAVRAFERVWARSWKQPDPNLHVIADWARFCAEQGWLRLGVAWLGETPIAVQFWIVQGGVATIYRLAYDEDYSGYSAGTILTAHLMERVLDGDMVREVDFLEGDEPYKRQWMSHRRERWGMRAFNSRTPAGLAQGAWHFGRKKVKSLAKPVLDACRAGR
ncbi:GNAT family N-acetyltransferase [Thiohalorhabdus sp. Cl-TMA]|uniref:GNAT family N-acetyltransferase n=1 Tax=Thiohalorhabdus methylotrophus TaxID=3242694 RepID=A0ABV4TZY3_9GAMM